MLISIFIALFIPKGLNVCIAISTSMDGASHVALEVKNLSATARHIHKRHRFDP